VGLQRLRIVGLHCQLGKGPTCWASRSARRRRSICSSSSTTAARSRSSGQYSESVAEADVEVRKPLPNVGLRVRDGVQHRAHSDCKTQCEPSSPAAIHTHFEIRRRAPHAAGGLALPPSGRRRHRSGDAYARPSSGCATGHHGTSSALPLPISLAEQGRRSPATRASPGCRSRGRRVASLPSFAHHVPGAAGRASPGSLKAERFSDAFKPHT
jgi:hypothetical protein